MDAQWIGVAVAAIAVTVSLAAFIRSGLARIREDYAKLEGAIAEQARQHREDFRALSEQHREDFRALSEQHREDFRALSEQYREDHATVTGKLAEIAERTARIEGILVAQGVAEFHPTAAQAVPEER